MELESVDMVFHYREGEKEVEIKGSIDSENGWSQWGASKEELGHNVHLIEALNGATVENGF